MGGTGVWPVGGVDYPQDSIEFAAWFPDDRACADYLAWLRWGDMEFVCHLCGAIACGWPRRDGLTWDCGACKSKTSVTAGTLFSKTRTPLTVWFRAAWDLTTRPNGQSARNLQRNLGLGSYQTAWTMLHRYRRAMVAPGRTRLSGVVELDETVVGGKNKPGKRGRAKDANRHIVGECFWGFELHGVVPDIVTMGKPLGNGHPLAAVVTTPAVAASFHNGMEYFNTFGGNPVSATIGQAVLDYVLDMRLQAHARDVGAYLQSGVRDLMTESPLIIDVRGHGLFLGIELQRDGIPATTEVADLIEFAKARGVMLSSDGPANNVFKIKPPMVIQREDVDLFLEVFRDGLREVNR